jgi:5-bromo-4-chloroindolyl phosphate hydrolysis protein
MIRFCENQDKTIIESNLDKKNVKSIMKDLNQDKRNIKNLNKDVKNEHKHQFKSLV